jgi:glyoxylase-like metal-dependent hydrolase (beta-lactamase superfamily II)
MVFCTVLTLAAYLLFEWENEMIIKTIPNGALEANCYILADEATNQAIIVDPGDEPDIILEQAEEFKVLYIVLTHGHFDHVGAVNDIKEATGAEVALHEADFDIYAGAKDHAAFWGFEIEPPDMPTLALKEGDELLVGDLSFVVIHTPGHSPGGMCLYSEGALITGDTLFAGSIGRTDLPGGEMNKMKESFRRLMGLPDETTILPGHGPSSTIGTEKEHNMFAAEFLG